MAAQQVTARIPYLGEVWEELDQVALAIGKSRYSLADLLTFFLTALAIYLVAKIIYWIIRKGVRRTPRLDAAQKLLIEKVAGIAIIGIAILIGIDLVGFNLSSLAVFSGALGLAVGFGLQKTFGNLIAGLILLMDRSVKPGDVIAVGDRLGQVGTISKIGVRAVSLITRDGKEHLIPNELLMTERVENWSYSSRDVRVQIPVGVSYASDLDEVEKILLDCAMKAKRVLKSPKPTVWLKEFGDSSVNFEIQAWIGDPEGGVGNVRSEVLKLIWKRFKEAGIEIPFPQRDVNVRSVPEEWVKSSE